MKRPVLSLKARAVGLLAQREHSRLELRRKLIAIERRARTAAAAGTTQPRSGQDDDVAPAELDAVDVADAAEAVEAAVDALLDTLSAEGYLSESRFIESRLHLRAQRFGAQRIQQELAQHGLKLDAEQQADLKASEFDRAREVWLRRFGPEPDPDLAAQAKQTRFLVARGFSPEVVRRLLRSPRSLD